MTLRLYVIIHMHWLTCHTFNSDTWIWSLCKNSTGRVFLYYKRMKNGCHEKQIIRTSMHMLLHGLHAINALQPFSIAVNTLQKLNLECLTFSKQKKVCSHNWLWLKTLLQWLMQQHVNVCPDDLFLKSVSIFPEHSRQGSYKDQMCKWFVQSW